METIHKYSSKPDLDVMEYLKRDILNVALGNSDNHARNTALLKYTDGTIRLAPLFDFAPMFLDPTGIRRSSRWQQEEGVGFPNWPTIVDELIKRKFLRPTVRKDVAALVTKVEKLPQLMRRHKTPKPVIDAFVDRIETVRRMLK